MKSIDWCFRARKAYLVWRNEFFFSSCRNLWWKKQDKLGPTEWNESIHYWLARCANSIWRRDFGLAKRLRGGLRLEVVAPGTILIPPWASLFLSSRPPHVKRRYFAVVKLTTAWIYRMFGSLVSILVIDDDVSGKPSIIITQSTLLKSTLENGINIENEAFDSPVRPTIIPTKYSSSMHSLIGIQFALSECAVATAATPKHAANRQVTTWICVAIDFMPSQHPCQHFERKDRKHYFRLFSAWGFITMFTLAKGLRNETCKSNEYSFLFSFSLSFRNDIRRQ